MTSRRAVLAALLVAPAARAQEVAPEFADLLGRPVAALAAHPAVGPRLRRMAAGRQRVVSDAVRGADGAPLAASGPWLHGWAASEEARCLLAFDTHTENVAIMLLEGGRPSLFIPPRFAPWPEALRDAVRGFAPDLYPTMRFG